jgi:hypothetical protein
MMEGGGGGGALTGHIIFLASTVYLVDHISPPLPALSEEFWFEQKSNVTALGV